MSDACSICNNPKAPLICGVCAASVCKSCAQFAGPEDLALLEQIPAYYEHGAFCQTCFDQKIAPELNEYNELVEKARNIDLFYKTQSKESRFVRRSEKAIKVRDCADKDTAVLKLAFLAAKGGFNILVDVETEFDKIRMHGWQSSKCHGMAVPAHVEPSQLQRRFIGSPN
jgi:hypothetical protein